ncbi:hypothetical protein OG871_38850 [Kitasatospora sp. NBC_00374]
MFEHDLDLFVEVRQRLGAVFRQVRAQRVVPGRSRAGAAWKVSSSMPRGWSAVGTHGLTANGRRVAAASAPVVASGWSGCRW